MFDDMIKLKNAKIIYDDSVKIFDKVLVHRDFIKQIYHSSYDYKSEEVFVSVETEDKEITFIFETSVENFKKMLYSQNHPEHGPFISKDMSVSSYNVTYFDLLNKKFLHLSGLKGKDFYLKVVDVIKTEMILAQKIKSLNSLELV